MLNVVKYSKKQGREGSEKKICDTNPVGGGGIKGKLLKISKRVWLNFKKKETLYVEAKFLCVDLGGFINLGGFF